MSIDGLCVACPLLAQRSQGDNVVIGCCFPNGLGHANRHRYILVGSSEKHELRSRRRRGSKGKRKGRGAREKRTPWTHGKDECDNDNEQAAHVEVAVCLPCDLVAVSAMCVACVVVVLLLQERERGD